MIRKVTFNEFKSQLDASLKDPETSELRFRLVDFSGQKFLFMACILDDFD